MVDDTQILSLSVCSGAHSFLVCEVLYLWSCFEFLFLSFFVPFVLGNLLSGTHRRNSDFKIEGLLEGFRAKTPQVKFGLLFA